MMKYGGGDRAGVDRAVPGGWSLLLALVAAVGCSDLAADRVDDQEGDASLAATGGPTAAPGTVVAPGGGGGAGG
ncbi:MAG: hypothetical protein PVI30_13775, partial [Myxococcales bacterium]